MPGKMCALAFLLLVRATAIAQTAPAAPKTTLLKAARLLDVRTGKYVTNAAILIENDKIKEAGPAAEVQAHVPKGATIIDLGAATLLPGLIDCHAHLLTAGTSIFPQEIILNAVAGMSPSARVLLGAHNAREDLEGGFTTVRVLGHSGIDGTAGCDQSRLVKRAAHIGCSQKACASRRTGSAIESGGCGTDFGPGVFAGEQC